jgi:hypothetical protein
MASTISTFCDDCRRITSSGTALLKKDQLSRNLDDLSATWLKKRFKNPGSYTGEEIGPFVMEFKGSFRDLEESAEKGCSCCLFFIETVREFGEATPKKSELLFIVRHTEEVGSDTIRFGGPKPKLTPAQRSRNGDYVCLYEETVPLARYNICIKGEIVPYDVTLPTERCRVGKHS